MSDETLTQANQAQSQAKQQGQQQQQHPMSISQHQQADKNVQVHLTLKLLMLGKEVGGIIGKKGDNIKRFREESGAKINISDGSCPERIVTLSGAVPDVFKAFTLICCKFEEGLLKTSKTPMMHATDASALVSSNSLDQASSNDQASSVASATAALPSIMGLTSVKDAQFNQTDEEILILNNNNNNNTSAINNNNLDAIVKNELNNSNNGTSNSNTPMITVRLIIPASLCGSLIGRGGFKIKEIREMTGATIQVAADVLPNSTERVVTIIGNVESITRSAYHICKIMVESPPKSLTIPYFPKPAINPMLLAAANVGAGVNTYLPRQYPLSASGDLNRLIAAVNNPLTASVGITINNPNDGASALATASRSQGMVNGFREMVIPNGLIGCVIGKGGSKINEIRQLSGATIRISNSEGTNNRVVTIHGTPEAINLAQYLITLTII